MNNISSHRSPLLQGSQDLSLVQPAGTAKLGAKGPGVRAWAQQNGIPLPANLYDCLNEQGAVIARVGSDELIVEAETGNALLAKVDQALGTPTPGVYRIEQQGATFLLRDPRATDILLQTCGVEMSAEPLNRIVYTRVAGVSCGLIPSEIEGQRSYRLWCDFTLAPYLWENLSTILSELP